MNISWFNVHYCKKMIDAYTIQTDILKEKKFYKYNNESFRMQLTANLKKKRNLSLLQEIQNKKSFKNFTEASPKMHVTLFSIRFRDLYVTYEYIYVLPGDLSLCSSTMEHISCIQRR